MFKAGGLLDSLVISTAFVCILLYFVYLNHKKPFYEFEGLAQICRPYSDITMNEILHMGSELGFEQEPKIWSGRQVTFFVRQASGSQNVSRRQFEVINSGLLIFSEAQIVPFMKEHCVVSVNRGKITGIRPI